MKEKMGKNPHFTREMLNLKTINMDEINNFFSLPQEKRFVPKARSEIFKRIDAAFYKDLIFGQETDNSELYNSFCDLAYKEQLNSFVLKCLRERIQIAIKEICNRNVPENYCVATFIYNMGFVFQAADCCFGVDLTGPFVEKMADILDFNFVSHFHRDHFSYKLLENLHIKGKTTFGISEDGVLKKVIQPPRNKMQFSSRNTKIKFKYIAGDHYPESFVKYCRLMKVSKEDIIQIKATINEKFKIFHCGDNFNRDKILKGLKGGIPDLLIIGGYPSLRRAKRKNKDVRLWQNLIKMTGNRMDVLKIIKPKFALLCHVMELGHSAFSIGGCGPFSDACENLEDLNQEGIVPMWGESIWFKI